MDDEALRRRMEDFRRAAEAAAEAEQARRLAEILKSQQKG